MLDKKGWWPGLWKQRSLWIGVLCTFFQSIPCQSLSGRSFIIVLQPFYHPHEMEYCGSACMLFDECTCIFNHAIKHTNQIRIHIRYYSDLPCSLHFTDRKVSPLFFPKVFLAGTNVVLSSVCTASKNSCINHFDHIGLIFFFFFHNAFWIDFSAKHVAK